MTRPVAISLGVLFSLLTASAGDWPLFRGDATMSGVGQAKLPDQLDERWAFKTGDSIEGSPAIVGGIVYVASMDKHLYALDLTTGKQIGRASCRERV